MASHISDDLLHIPISCQIKEGLPFFLLCYWTGLALEGGRKKEEEEV